MIIASFGYLLSIKDLKYSEVHIEIAINKVVDLYNSQLLRTYTLIDRRFHILSLILKDWNKKKFPDKIKRMNSYSIVLMLIAFLQLKHVLPRLQQNCDKKIVKY